MAVEIILFDNVRNLGRMGDTVRVADGYFRNFLRPKGFADVATPGNKARFEKMKVKTMAINAERLSEAVEAQKVLEALTDVKVGAKAGDNDRLFGSVSPQDVVDAIRAAGLAVERKQIEILEPIKTLGVHKVGVRIHPDVVANVDVNVVRA